MVRALWAAVCLPGAWAAGSLYDWQDVLGTTWMFDGGSTHGYIPEAMKGGQGWQLRGPAPDWNFGDSRIPSWAFEVLPAAGEPAGRTPLKAAQFPGVLRLTEVASGDLAVGLTADAAFAARSVLLLRLTIQNPDTSRSLAARFRISGAAANWTSRDGAWSFPMPPVGPDVPCLDGAEYEEGRVYLVNGALAGGSDEQAMSWTVEASGAALELRSSAVEVPAGGEAVAFLAISSVASLAPAALPLLRSAQAAAAAFSTVESSWSRYVSVVTEPQGARQPSPDEQWVAVKALQTLIYNWRFVPGFPDGVLPSYVGYEGGFWSWDSYKSAVGMAPFAPDLAKEQLRLIVAARDPATGHIPDKVDRCGRGGGCNGKPPLLSWAVWEVYAATNDEQFLSEMRPAIEAFHRFWYEHRDVQGVGLCSWTEGMESGMDDGVRFMPQYAKTVSNASSHVSALDFWSIDLNAYLYREKRVLGDIARALGDEPAAQRWAAEADALLPRLQRAFFVPGPTAGRGFFQDTYFNGTALPVQGCEGYAALFCGVATQQQAEAVAVTLSDPTAFLLNFSLPTVSKRDQNFNGRGYWKGSAWLDQTWFAYTGLMSYAAKAPKLAELAQTVRRNVFARGRGFRAQDSTPLNEHYDPDTGEPLGAAHFSWSAAHSLLWVLEGSGLQIQI